MSGRLIDLVVVHHSASPCSTSLEEIRGWHMNPQRKGGAMLDIGYHYVVEEHGAVRVGRPLWQEGAHCLGRNANSVGICVTGNNTVPAEHWNASQVFSLRELVNAIRLLFPGIEVYGHRDTPGGKTPTECPGLGHSLAAIGREEGLRILVVKSYFGWSEQTVFSMPQSIVCGGIGLQSVTRWVSPNTSPLAIRPEWALL